MKLVIVYFDEDPSDRLVRWAYFHRMNYEIVIGQKSNISNSVIYEHSENNDDYNLIVTSDLVPQTKIFLHILEKKEIGTPFRLIKTNNSKIWRPSFCILTKAKLQIENISNNPNCWLDLYTQNVEMIENIATKDPTKALDLITKGIGERFDLLWSIIVDDWYGGVNLHVSHFYYHLWIESYHKHFLKTGDTKKRDWIREQSCFGGLVDRVKIEETITIPELKEKISDSKLTVDDFLNGHVKGYEVNVDASPEMFMLHPFSIHGRYLARPIREVQIDRSITLVGFYYDLGYSDKPIDGYIRSFEYYCRLKYPMVFYGSKETCDLILKLRGEELASFTKIIVREAEEWPLINKFKEDYKEMDLDRVFRNRRRYALLTCNKVYAIMDAIKNNYFLSDNFIWHDPGLYRHELARGIKLEAHPYKNFPIPERGIATPSFCPACGSTDEEYKEGHESIITGILIGSIEGWNEFYKHYDKLVMTSFVLGNISTEQVVCTRVKGIYPELMTCVDFSYLGESVNKYLRLDWEE